MNLPFQYRICGFRWCICRVAGASGIRVYVFKCTLLGWGYRGRSRADIGCVFLFKIWELRVANRVWDWGLGLWGFEFLSCLVFSACFCTNGQCADELKVGQLRHRFSLRSGYTLFRHPPPFCFFVRVRFCGREAFNMPTDRVLRALNVPTDRVLPALTKCLPFSGEIRLGVA